VSGPQRFVGDLIARGRTVACEGRGFVRLNWPGLADRPALFVPTDPSAPEFPNLWQAVQAELEDAVATGVPAGSSNAAAPASRPAACRYRQAERYQ